MEDIRRVCKEKQISQLRFEVHWMYHKHVQKWKDYFKKQGITLKIKMGVETFDDTFRREVFDKGMEGVMPEEIAGVADEVCLLFGISGQTAESMQKVIETGLKYFARICINIMVEITTPIRPDQEVIRLFVEQIYPKYKENQSVDILLQNTDFGVGGEAKEIEENE